MNKCLKYPIVVALAIAIGLTTASHTLAQEFLPFEGKNTEREGEGGTKKVVDGIDFWADGAPPYKFKLLGYITDRRHKTGLLGMVRMSGLESEIADVAKKNGGDAVILVSSEAETVGTVGSSMGGGQATANTVGSQTNVRATGWSGGASAAVQKQQSKFAVVKYLQRPTHSGSPPAATAVVASPAGETKPELHGTPALPATPPPN